MIGLALLHMFVMARGLTSPELKAQLLDKYDKEIWPGSYSATPGPTTVRIQYYVNSLWGINQKSQEFQAEIYFRAFWKDSRLAYDRNLMSHELHFSNDAYLLWLPNFYWANSRGVRNDESLLKVYPDGSIWWSQRKRVAFTCHMYFHRLPFDTQACSMVVSTYSNPTREVKFEWKDEKAVAEGLELVTNNEWAISHYANGTKVVRVFSGEEYEEMGAHMTFTRRANVMAIFTSILFVLISYCGFWINPAAAPGRIALSVICVLIVVTSLINEMRGYPNIAYSVWLETFMTGCLLFNLSAVFEYALVNFGITSLARLADERKKDTGPDLDEIELQLPLGAILPASASFWMRYREPFFMFCQKLDVYFRVLFPVAFITFLITVYTYEPPHPEQ